MSAGEGTHDREALEAAERLGRAERGAAGGAFEARVSAAAADAALSAWLDDLAAAEAGTPDAGFERRLLDAVAPATAPAPLRLATHGRAGRWAAAAAVLGLVAGGAWLAVRPGAPPEPREAGAALAQDMGLLLEMYEEPSWSVELVDLRSRAESVSDALGSPWQAFEAVSESLAEGAL